LFFERFASRKKKRCFDKLSTNGIGAADRYFRDLVPLVSYYLKSGRTGGENAR